MIGASGGKGTWGLYHLPIFCKSKTVPKIKCIMSLHVQCDGPHHIPTSGGRNESGGEAHPGSHRSWDSGLLVSGQRPSQGVLTMTLRLHVQVWEMEILISNQFT